MLLFHVKFLLTCFTVIIMVWFGYGYTVWLVRAQSKILTMGGDTIFLDHKANATMQQIKATHCKIISEKNKFSEFRTFPLLRPCF